MQPPPPTSGQSYCEFVWEKGVLRKSWRRRHLQLWHLNNWDIFLDRQTDRQTNRQTDRQTDRHTLWFIGKLHFQKFIFLPRMSIQKENLKSEPKKIGLKRPIFWCTIIQAVKFKMLDFFLQNVHLITKYLLKISLITSIQVGLFC